MLKIGSCEFLNEEVYINFSFKVNGKLHQVEDHYISRNFAEYYIRDCSHTLLSFNYYQLIDDIKQNLPKYKYYNADQMKNLTQLEKYAKILLNKDLEQTSKFINKYKTNLLFIIPTTDVNLCNKAKEIIEFAEKTYQIMERNKLLIKEL